ncbi:RloB family protein [Streptomyces palmae]|uniref:RloB domain-containing protein n=1 Tax=Streptomyces palmae TaxID=1701085 RepID=A0A4Z0HHB2_9ACTN|nr:RloB family protein [Streptomyces palmae]TGB19392.1 RloB domain-containing protein [Streptomyces palmae]
MARTRGKDSTDRKQRPSKRQPTVWVYTEGTLTEPQYIDIVRQRRAPGLRISVRIANDERTHGGTKGPRNPTYDRKPLDLVEQAVAKLREERRKEKREKWPDPPKGTTWTTVWCLFDRDDHQGVDKAIGQAQAAGVKIAYSYPCFELWRLLHHRDYTSTFGRDCDNVTKRLPFITAQTSKEEAKIVRPEQILKDPSDGYLKAKARAKRINAQYGDHVPHSKRDPYTDVWNFVEDGLGVTDY